MTNPATTSSAHWATIDPSTDNDLSKISTLLGGAQFRARSGGPVLGKVALIKGALSLAFSDGTSNRLTAVGSKRYAFDIDRERASASVSRTPMQIVSAVPGWAKETVAKHLMPSEYAAYQQQQEAAQAAQREARKEQLSNIGAAVSGRKSAIDAPRDEQLTAAQKARRAQLREIGKAVSAGR